MRINYPGSLIHKNTVYYFTNFTQKKTLVEFFQVRDEIRYIL